MSSREQYRGVFLPGCTLDDRLWHQALVTNRYMTERRGFGVRRPDEERALFHLIKMGLLMPLSWTTLCRVHEIHEVYGGGGGPALVHH
jgi:hypothetical protein